LKRDLRFLPLVVHAHLRGHDRRILIGVHQRKIVLVGIQRHAGSRLTLNRVVIAQIERLGFGLAVRARGDGIHHGPGLGPDCAVRRDNIRPGHDVEHRARQPAHFICRGILNI